MQADFDFGRAANDLTVTSQTFITWANLRKTPRYNPPKKRGKNLIASALAALNADDSADATAGRKASVEQRMAQATKFPGRERSGNASQRSCSAGSMGCDSSGECGEVFSKSFRGSAAPLETTLS